MESCFGHSAIITASVDVSSMECQTVYVTLVQLHDLKNLEIVLVILQDHQLGRVCGKQSWSFGKEQEF